MEIRRLDMGEAEVSPAASGRLVRADGTSSPALWQVPEETPVAILLNGDSFAVMMATPSDLEDFAVGFALTEGVIRDQAQIETLRIAEAADGLIVNLTLDPGLVAASEDRKRTLAGRGGCGICGARTIDAALPPPPRVRGPLPAPSAVLSAFAAFPEAQRMKRGNRSTHAAAFCSLTGEILALREDVGRHNALDKLVGALARDGRRGAGRGGAGRSLEGFVMLSSRVGVEMVQKAAHLGAPYLAAVSAPSALALRMAARAGMTVAGLSGEALMLFDPVSPNDPALRREQA